LAGITGDEMNKNFNELRRQFRQEAIENEHVLDKAKMRADSVMKMLLGPTVRSMGRSLKMEVRFQNSQNQPETAEDLRRQGSDNQTPPKLKDPVPPSDAPRSTRDKKKVLAN
jgi:hypothetical protein